MTPIISLGSHCYPAWLVRRMGGRDAAYPFDWLWSDPLMVVDCIADGFSTFLDRRYHAKFGSSGSKSTHTIYAPRYRRELTFNHHDITVDAEYEQFCRAADRFMTLLRSSGEKKRFFLLADEGRLPDSSFDAVLAALQNSGSDNELIAVRMMNVSPQRNMVVRHSQPGGRLFDFWPTSKMQSGLAFENEADNKAVEELITTS